MSYTDIIVERIHRNRKILVEQADSPLISLTIRFETLSHKDTIRFAFKAILPILDELIDQTNRIDLQEPFDNSKAWAAGLLKMQDVKPLILRLHNDAKETNNLALEALYHAYGQGLSVIHTKKHAMGLPIYELTAKIRQTQPENYENVVNKTIQHYHEILNQIEREPDLNTWALFIQK